MNALLETALNDLVATPLQDSALQHAMYDAVFPGGSRWRPRLLMAVAQALKVDQKLSLACAVAVELVHCYSLVHDDWMDGDVERRGSPSIWAKYNPSVAILTGNALFALAFEVLAKACVPLSVIQALAYACGPQGMMAGQSLDLSNSSHPQVASLKTGCLFQFCCEAPALLANLPLKGFQELGQKIGLYYQALDDDQDQGSSSFKPQEAFEDLKGSLQELKLSEIVQPLIWEMF